MKHSESDLLKLLDMIYSAGLGDRSWSEGLKSLADFFGAAAGVAIDVDRATGRVPVMRVHGFDEKLIPEYLDRMHAINPRLRAQSERPGSHTTWDYDKIAEDEMRRDEFYNWLERTCGTKYFVGARTIDGDDRISFATIDFRAKHGHVTPAEIELFKRLSPHLANSWRISRAFGRVAAVQGAFEALQDSVPWGVIGLDRVGRVVTMNGRARAAVERMDGLKVEKGQLRALRAAEDRTLKLIVAHTLRAAHGESLYPGGAIAVPRRNGYPPYALRVTPTRCHATVVPDAAPAVLVLIAEPGARPVPQREHLMAIFGLSGREADLAQRIAGGVSLSEAADQMNIARNTARVHLSNILRKTGARGQGALSGLVNSLPVDAAQY
jgi:DNA-binding CsgD family transcriptional regulator